jgi:hypothetical protein
MAEGGDGDAWIEPPEFPMLLVNLFYFNKLFRLFDDVDADGDRRLDLNEFKEGILLLDLELEGTNADTEFRIVDANQSGYILFEEFCVWYTGKVAPEREIVSSTTKFVDSSTPAKKKASLKKKSKTAAATASLHTGSLSRANSKPGWVEDWHRERVVTGTQKVGYVPASQSNQSLPCFAAWRAQLLIPNQQQLQNPPAGLARSTHGPNPTHYNPVPTTVNRTYWSPTKSSAPSPEKHAWTPPKVSTQRAQFRREFVASKTSEDEKRAKEYADRVRRRGESYRAETHAAVEARAERDAEYAGRRARVAVLAQGEHAELQHHRDERFGEVVARQQRVRDRAHAAAKLPSTGVGVV